MFHRAAAILAVLLVMLQSLPAYCQSQDQSRWVLNFSEGTRLLEESRQLASSMLNAIKAAPPMSVVEIAGHTCISGDEERNYRLSMKRSQQISRMLTRSGIPSSRLRLVAFGASRPLADNRSVEGRSQNRRVEVTLITPTAGSPAGWLIEARGDVTSSPGSRPVPVHPVSEGQPLETGINGLALLQMVDGSFLRL